MCEQFKTFKQLIDEAEIVFQEKFEGKPDVISFGPGRVNIIGEHTDYNDGFVFPMALPMGTVVLGRKNNLDECRVFSMSADIVDSKLVTFTIPKSSSIKKSPIKWSNYIIGVVSYFQCSSKDCFDAVINSSVPLGSGLSSSASLEVATYTFLEGLYQVKEQINLSEKALLCQKVEHDYAEVPCGIMDQFISFMGQRDHALLIDCKDLTSKLVKIGENSISILVINSNVKHNLGSSEYPLRRKQCNLAAQILNVKSLREVPLEILESAIDKLEPTVYIRARHVITENNRVLKAVHALNNSDFQEIGKLMNQSHKSLKEDFEVSCKEIDFLVEIVQSCKGVLGSRMTGGGFGGCTVSLVYKSEIEHVVKEVKTKYPGNALIYVCTASDGARLIN